jgi:hypothetical protein
VNTTNAVILSAILTVAGQWARKKPLTVKVGVGAVFTALALASLANIDQKLAGDFAVLILVASTLYNGPVLFAAVGKATT